MSTVSSASIPDRLPTAGDITEEHQALLARSAIPLEVALAAGVRSITDADQLPPELAARADQLPGLLFWLSSLGGAEPIPQLRPDDPSDGKYLCPAGSGAVISDLRQSPELTATAPRALLVEGTKQGLAAAAWAPADMLVAGIQGAGNWSSDGTPVPDLDLVAVTSGGAGRQVVIALDADRATNRSVWEAASRLGEHLTAVGATSVRYLALPAGGRAGLDDWLAGRAIETRAGSLARLLDRAGELGRAPARAKSTAEAEGNPEVPGAVVDTAAGVVRTQPGPNGEPPQTLLSVAPRIVETVVEIDDLQPGDHEVEISHRLELLRPTGRPIAITRLVPDTQLGRIRDWIGQAADGSGGAVTIAPGWIAAAEAENAIRRHEADERRVVQRRRRTGWLLADPDRPVWLADSGAIGPDGRVSDASGHGDAEVAPFAPPGVDEVEAVRALLDVGSQLVAPAPWWAVLTRTLHALAGGRPTGTLVVLGFGRSGKTTIVQSVTSMLGARWADKPMMSAKGSTPAIADAGAGMHHCVMHVDDAVPQRNPVEAARMGDSLDHLFRRGIDGGAAGRERLTRSDSRLGPSFRRDVKDMAHPQIILTIEEIPPGPDSGRARCFFARVPSRASTWREDGVTWPRVMADAQRLHPAAGESYLSWVARRIRDRGWQDWTSWLDEHSTEVSWPCYSGLRLLEAWLTDLGFEPADIARLVDEGRRHIDQLASEQAGILREESSGEVLLAKLRSGIACGDLAIHGHSSSDGILPRQKVAGAKVTADGHPAVAIIADVAAGYAGTTREALRAALRPLVIPGRDGSPVRVSRIGGATVSCFVFALRVWEGEASDTTLDDGEPEDF